MAVARETHLHGLSLPSSWILIYFGSKTDLNKVVIGQMKVVWMVLLYEPMPINFPTGSWAVWKGWTIWILYYRPLWGVELCKDVWEVCNKPNVALHTWHVPSHSPSTLPGNHGGKCSCPGGSPSGEGNADLSDVAEWVHFKSWHWGPKTTSSLCSEENQSDHNYKRINKTGGHVQTPTQIDSDQETHFPCHKGQEWAEAWDILWTLHLP